MIAVTWLTLGIIALGLGGLALLLRALGQAAARKLVTLEFEEVLNSDEYKVRGRFE